MATAEPKINAILPYFGGKRTLAPEIVAELGPHHAYWGLCCGSLAVEFAKEPCRAESVVDLHGGVICLARVLACELQSAFLYERVKKTVFCDALHEDAEAFLAEAGGDGWWLGRSDRNGERPGVIRADANMREYAYWFLVASWMGRNGTAGTARSTSNFCVRYTNKGGDPGTRFRAVAESIPAWHERLRGMTILRRDIFEVLPKLPDESGLVVYIDPPYLRKSHAYRHDFEDGDHARLAEVLRGFRSARLVVSYYDEPELQDLYPGWTRRRLKASKFTANDSKRDRTGATEAPEVLLINGPSLVETDEPRRLFA